MAMLKKLASAVVIGILALGTAACSGGYVAIVSAFERTDDPRKIVVSVGSGFCDELDRYEVHEDIERVQVNAWVNGAPHDRPCPGGGLDAMKIILVEISLASDLGDRTVVGSGGERIPERAAQRTLPVYFERTGDPTKIVIGTTVIGCSTVDRIEVHEDTSQVKIELYVIGPSYRTACATPLSGSGTIRTEIALGSPLMDRTVVDVNGDPVRELSPSATPT